RQPHAPRLPLHLQVHSEDAMSIRFGWSRPQAGSEATDDEKVEDGSSAPRNRMPVTPPSPEQVQAVWDVHARVAETERRTHHRFGAAAARRAFQATLLEERDALQSLGFESFAAFEAVHGPPATATSTTEEPKTEEPQAGETIGRIRVLLDELGIEPGVDPLQAAKEFLDVVESADAPRPEVTTAIDAPARSETLSPIASTPAGGPAPPAPRVPAREEAVAEETHAPTAAGAARAGQPVTASSEESDVELADARAERWHAELEHAHDALAVS